ATPFATAVTDATGAYRFPGLGAGTYRAREAAQPGWYQTSADPADITAVSGQDVAGINFGNHQLGSNLPAVGPTATKDNGQLLYNETGLWSTVTGGGWNNSYRTLATNGSGTGSRTARWTLGVAPGLYEVFVTYPADAGNVANAPYRVLKGSTLLGT